MQTLHDAGAIRLPCMADGGSGRPNSAELRSVGRWAQQAAVRAGAVWDGGVGVRTGLAWLHARCARVNMDAFDKIHPTYRVAHDGFAKCTLQPCRHDGMLLCHTNRMAAQCAFHVAQDGRRRRRRAAPFCNRPDRHGSPVGVPAGAAQHAGHHCRLRWGMRGCWRVRRRKPVGYCVS